MMTSQRNGLYYVFVFFKFIKLSSGLPDKVHRKIHSNNNVNSAPDILYKVQSV